MAGGTCGNDTSRVVVEKATLKVYLGSIINVLTFLPNMGEVPYSSIGNIIFEVLYW